MPAESSLLEPCQALGCCTGGRGVIEGLGSQLKLNEQQRQPSAQTLYHYGAPAGSLVMSQHTHNHCFAAKHSVS
jgi:hypothetical protein